MQWGSLPLTRKQRNSSQIPCDDLHIQLALKVGSLSIGMTRVHDMPVKNDGLVAAASICPMPDCGVMCCQSASERTINGSCRQWYAIYTQFKHEKKVAERLHAAGIESFVPLCRVARHWNNRQTRVIGFPVFPSYVFARMDIADRICVLTIAGVVSFVEDGRGPILVPEHDIELMQISMKEYRLESHVAGGNGCQAKVVHGPLAGVWAPCFPSTIRRVLSFQSPPFSRHSRFT